jgi:hypothetical protein
MDGRTFPWGEAFDSGHYANFADKRTSFAWRDATIDDGYAETSPVGSYARGASPFGIEDMAGNVFEWCLDFFEAYRGKEKVNPRGPATGAKRNYRGGSWKSRAGSLRATARQSNLPEYSSNDVGFRIVASATDARQERGLAGKPPYGVSAFLPRERLGMRSDGGVCRGARPGLLVQARTARLRITPRPV